MTKFFDHILHHLKSLQLHEAFASEQDLQDMLVQFLKSKNISCKVQQTSQNKRYDVVCFDFHKSSTVCIELKIRAETSHVTQFDKYHKDFADGFIILCWNASTPLKEIFEDVILQSPTPVALVELSRQHSMI